MQDPLADKAQDWMAYRYGFNNPMRFTDPTGMFEAGMMRAGKNASIQERSAGKDTQNMEGETDALDEGRYQNLQNSVLGYLDAQGTEGSNNNTSKGGLQKMAKAGLFDFDISKITSGDVGNTIGGLSYVAGALGNKTGKILSDRAGWGRQYSNSKTLIKTRIGGIEVSTKALSKTATALKIGSKALGAFGLGVTYYQLRNNQISGTEAAVDAFFGAVGFIPGWGTAASLIYFGGKFMYEYSTGESLFEKPQPLTSP